jgi:hypothetical protein
MVLNSIYLDPKSLEETNGTYGIVAQITNTSASQQRFTEHYVSKVMLLDNLQNKLNDIAGNLCNMPEDGDRTSATAEWQMLRSVYEEIKASY